MIHRLYLKGLRLNVLMHHQMTSPTEDGEVAHLPRERWTPSGLNHPVTISVLYCGRGIRLDTSVLLCTNTYCIYLFRNIL